MTDEQREAYRAAFASAEKRVRTGQRIHHCRWQDGRLEDQVRSAKDDLEPPTGSTIPDLPTRAARRGLVQPELGL